MTVELKTHHKIHNMSIENNEPLILYNKLAVCSEFSVQESTEALSTGFLDTVEVLLDTGSASAGKV